MHCLLDVWCCDHALGVALLNIAPDFNCKTTNEHGLSQVIRWWGMKQVKMINS